MKKFKKNDVVIVITGKDKGKTGKITQVIADTHVVIENVNRYKKHLKRSEKNQGGIVDINKPIHISNVMHYSENKKTQSRIKIETDKKGKYRVLKKTLEKV
mgnify:CR=1 FL=1